MQTLEKWLEDHPNTEWNAHYGEDQKGGFGLKGWDAYGAGSNAWALYVLGVKWETHKRKVPLWTRLLPDGRVHIEWGTEEFPFADVLVTLKVFWDEDHPGQ